MMVNWIPGGSHGLVWEQGLALVSGELTITAAVELWQRCATGVTMGGFLETLAKLSGASLLELPPFALVLDSGQITNVAVRGEMLVNLESTEGAEQISGAKVSTWVERQLVGVTSVQLTSPDAEPGDARPITVGLVPAGILAWGKTAHSYAEPKVTEQSIVENIPTPVENIPTPPESDETPDELVVEIDVAGVPGYVVEVDDEPAVDGILDPIPSKPATDIGVADEAENEVEDNEATSERRLPENLADNIASDPEEAVELATEEPAGEAGGVQGDMPETLVEPTPKPASHAVTLIPGVPANTPPPPPPPAPTAPKPEQQPNEYEMLWGATRMVSVDEAGLDHVDPEAVAAAEQPVFTLSDVDDHDSMTVLDLPDEPKLLDSEVPQPPLAGESVVAVICPLEHPNPTHRSQCRVCGAPLSQNSCRIERPSLGWLQAPDGEVIELSQPVVVGRDPRADRIRGTDIPRLLVLPHGHISSNHLAIRLEGWNVMAVDLNSTNGTMLRRPNQPPVRLPTQPTLLASDDVLDLGHGLIIRFKDLP